MQITISHYAFSYFKNIVCFIIVNFIEIYPTHSQTHNNNNNYYYYLNIYF